MVGLSGIQMALKNQTIWHPTSFQPFQYQQTSSVFRSPLYIKIHKTAIESHSITKYIFWRKLIRIQQVDSVWGATGWRNPVHSGWTGNNKLHSHNSHEFGLVKFQKTKLRLILDCTKQFFKLDPLTRVQSFSNLFLGYSLTKNVLIIMLWSHMAQQLFYKWRRNL